MYTTDQRKENNRKAAKIFREKKKHRIEYLEQTVKYLQKREVDQKYTIKQLTNHVIELQMTLKNIKEQKYPTWEFDGFLNIDK